MPREHTGSVSYRNSVDLGSVQRARENAEPLQPVPRRTSQHSTTPVLGSLTPGRPRPASVRVSARLSVSEHDVTPRESPAARGSGKPASEPVYRDYAVEPEDVAYTPHVRQDENGDYFIRLYANEQKEEVGHVIPSDPKTEQLSHAEPVQNIVPAQGPVPVRNVVPAAQLDAAQFAQLPPNVQQEALGVLADAGFHSGTHGVTNPLDDRFWHGYTPDRLQAAHNLLARTLQNLNTDFYDRQLAYNGAQMDGLSAIGGAFSQHTALNNFQLQMIEALNAIMNKVGHLIAEAAKGH